jgi:hypothetical protein
MRRVPILLAVLAAALAWSAQAQPVMDDARADFQAELSRQCPEKQLQMLPVRSLRDGLDDYMQGLSQDERDQMQQAERARCSTMEAGAACVNDADIATLDTTGHIADLAGSICATFLRCRDQGACDYAR